MRFYTNFRDLGYFFDMLLDSPFKGLTVLCLALLVGIIISLFFRSKRR